MTAPEPQTARNPGDPPSGGLPGPLPPATADGTTQRTPVAATINSELIVRQLLADTIRDAAHRCPDQEIVPPGPVPPGTCNCDDRRTIYASLEVEGTLTEVCATPEAFAEVCAGAVQRELNAAQNALISMAGRAAELRQRAEAAEEQLAHLRTHQQNGHQP